MDAISFVFLLYNFAVRRRPCFAVSVDGYSVHADLSAYTQAVGVIALFIWPVPLLLKQGYLICTAQVTAFIFSYIPEWTCFTLLLAMAAYDLVSVLAPRGPLRVRCAALLLRYATLLLLAFGKPYVVGPGKSVCKSLR